MAKVGYSIFTPDISGRQGSTVFSKNASGQYMKPFKAPTNKRTPKQCALRVFEKLLAQSWAFLTSVQRLLWNSKAASGQTGTYKTKNGQKVKLSGFMLYMWHNTMLHIIGQPKISTCPVNFTAPAVGPLTFEPDCVATPGTEDITLSFGAGNLPDASCKYVIKSTGPLSAGREPNWKNQKVVTVIDSTFLDGGSIKDAFIAVFGSLIPAGVRCGFSAEAVGIADGTVGGLNQAIATGTI